MTEKGSARQSGRLNSSTESPQGKGTASETADSEKKLIRTRSVTQAIQSAAEKKAQEERQRLRVEKRARRQAKATEASAQSTESQLSELKSEHLIQLNDFF